MRQFTVGKSFDTFTPMGPLVASVDSVDTDAIGVSTVITGEKMQDGSSRDLIFSIPELVAYLSHGTTLEPGDVMATGTPVVWGTSARRRAIYMVDGVCTLVTSVVGEQQGPRSLQSAEVRCRHAVHPGTAARRERAVGPVRCASPTCLWATSTGSCGTRDHPRVKPWVEGSHPLGAGPLWASVPQPVVRVPQPVGFEKRGG
jgi:hypothetical protein